MSFEELDEFTEVYAELAECKRVLYRIAELVYGGHIGAACTQAQLWQKKEKEKEQQRKQESENPI